MINVTHQNLRRNIGVLGILLPVILAIGNGFDIKPSISHFYYTPMGIVFTGILWVFGLLLFSYRGHDRIDNLWTNISGVLILIVSVIPTSCLPGECNAVNAHTHAVLNLVHLTCAASFFMLMGAMSFFRFSISKKNRKLYRICGAMVWVSIGSLAIDVFFDLKITEIDVFLGESIALFFFGSAWLVKSKSLRSIGL